MTLRNTWLAAAAALALALPAQAALVGTTANGQLSAPCCGAILDENAVVVTPGVEFTFFGNDGALVRADLSDSAISLILFTANDDVGIGENVTWTFQLAPGLVFTSIVETSDNFVNGASLTAFSGGTASFLILNQSHGTNQTFTATYGISVTDTTAVPAPAALALFGLGLAALGVARRRA